MEKTASQNTKCSRNETILKMEHHAKAIYSLRKIVSLGQKLKVKKKSEKRFFNHIRVVLCKKNRFTKHQIFEKSDDFENRPSCKGYSLCKLVSLGQKLKAEKRCQKRFFIHIGVVLCKKPLHKTPNVREIRRF